MKDQELEVKFFVSDLARIEARLRSLGARLEMPRVLERNLRFDTPAGDLARAMQVLRLRQDTQAHITYKGPARDAGGARLRQEIEFVASDFDSARALIQALGFVVSMGYEKYRTTYLWSEVHVTLDEMPYGNFIEIEGSDPLTLQRVTAQLGLDWEQRVSASYVVLFDILRQRMDLAFRDLSFDNFQGLTITAGDLGVQPADKKSIP